MTVQVDLTRPDDISDKEWMAMKREALDRVKDAAPVKTGNLRDSLRLVGDSIVSDVDYAGYVDKGTRNMSPRNFTAILDYLR